jgi:hypothetical protein
MADISDDRDHCLGRAKEARDAAKRISDQEMRNILEEIAKSYERIAELIASGGSTGGQSKP